MHRQNRDSAACVSLCQALLVAIAVLSLVTAPAGAQLHRQAAGAFIIVLEVRPRSEVTETAMIVTLTDAAGNPVATDKATGRADFSSGGLKGSATLHPEGANRMKGYGLMSGKPDLAIAVTVRLPGEPEAKATFFPLRRGSGRP